MREIPEFCKGFSFEGLSRLAACNTPVNGEKRVGWGIRHANIEYNFRRWKT